MKPVTAATIEEQVRDVHYYQPVGTLNMLCIMTLNSGMTYVGQAVALLPERFDEELGRTYSYQDATEQAIAGEVHHRLALHLAETGVAVK